MQPPADPDRRLQRIVAIIAGLAVVALVVAVILVHQATSQPVATTAQSPPPSVAPSLPPTVAPPAPTATPAPTAPSPPPLSGADYAGPQQVLLTDPNGPHDVATRLFPSGPGGASCGSMNNTYASDCPVTHHFGTRLHDLYAARPPYEPLCRCLAAWASVQFTTASAGPHSNDPNYAAVAALFTINGSREQLTILVARTVDGWLAEDTWCGGDVGQTMYSSQPPGCPAS